MSREIEVVLAVADAFNAGDFDALTELLAPEVVAVADGPEVGPLHGRIEFRAFAEGTRSAWEDSRWEKVEVSEARPDRIVYRGVWRGQGAASGIVASTELTGIFTVRAGRVDRAEFYFDHHKALKAAGLEV